MSDTTPLLEVDLPETVQWEYTDTLIVNGSLAAKDASDLSNEHGMRPAGQREWLFYWHDDMCPKAVAKIIRQAYELGRRDGCQAGVGVSRIEGGDKDG
jgi:hypothetical protein